MRRSQLTRRRAACAALLAAVPMAGFVAASPASALPAVQVVAGGLLNPRGVHVGADGSVYVAEAGAGGDELVEALVEGEPGFACLGMTGGVTRVDKRGGVTRFGGMPSVAGAEETLDGPTCEGTGFAATGPHDVAATGRGTLAVTIGLGGSLETREALSDRLGTLERLLPNGRSRQLADLAAFEESDPAGDGVDSNPYGTAFMPDGSRLVVDAGGNDLLRVWPNGRVTTVATFGPDFDTVVPELSCPPPPPPFFPPAGTPIPAQAVPTAVAYHDGAAYVGFLGGFPFTPGHATIVRVDLATGGVTTVADGLTAVVGLDVARDGTIYAVEIARNGLLEAEICGDAAGRLVRIDDGVVTEIPVPGLTAPGGVAVGRDGTIYVTNGSIFPGFGELWAINT